MVYVTVPLGYDFGFSAVHHPVAIQDEDVGVVGPFAASAYIDDGEVAVGYFLFKDGKCPDVELAAVVGGEV